MNVTKTYLPPLEQFNEYLKRIWSSGSATNYGPLVEELEGKLKEYFGARHLFLQDREDYVQDQHQRLKNTNSKEKILTKPCFLAIFKLFP